jgi:hypothetical protein
MDFKPIIAYKEAQAKQLDATAEMAEIWGGMTPAQRDTAMTVAKWK